MVRSGISTPNSAMMSNSSRPSSAVERLHGVAAHERFEVQHPPRREDAGQQRSMGVVDRRVLEEQDPRWDLDAGLHDLEHRSATGAVRVPVEQRRLDVVPAAQRPEAVLLVAVQGGLIPKAGPRRIRIVVDLDVVGVVVDRGCGRARAHRCPSITRSRSSHAVQRLVLHAGEQLLGRPGGHLAHQLRGEMGREHRQVEGVPDDDDGDDREQRDPT